MCILVTTGLPADDIYPSEIARDASASLQITVRSADDKTSPHARIEMSENRDGSKPFEMRETSAGVFHCNPSPGLYRIRIAAHGWRDATLDAIRVTPRESLKLVVPLYPESWHGSCRGSVISGRVLDAKGSPLEGAECCVSTRSSHPLALLGFKDMKDVYISLSSDCYADFIGAGYFRIWLPFSHRCFVEMKAPGLAIQYLGEFTLKDGDKIGVGDLVLSQKESVISGQIVSAADRKPLEGIPVSAEGGNVKGYCLRADTDREGRFAIHNLPAGNYTLSIYCWCKDPEFKSREISKISISPEENKVLPPIEIKRLRQRKERSRSD
jgi:hypothetical protein